MINVMNFNKKYNKLFNLIYPEHIKCIFCGNELASPNEYNMCEKCMQDVSFITKDFCPRCGTQMPKDSIGVCKACKNSNYEFDYARACFVYDGKVKSVIRKLKFKDGKYLIEPLSNALYYLLNSINWNIDFITFVPLHESRLKTRGFNQSELLALHLGKRTNLPVVNCFEKAKNTPTQTSLTRSERKKNLIDAFKMINKSVKDKNLLIIDDIFTTGATTNELSKLLKEKGANKVYVLTLAHTQDKHEL